MTAARFPLLLPQILIVLLATGHAQSSAPQKRPSQPAVQHASWSDYLERSYDIRKQDFADMGLSALTVGQFFTVLAWAEVRAQKAKDSVPQSSVVCGRPGSSGEKPEDYDKVRLYVSGNGDASEIISGVRERLRTMSGIEVVYSSGQADLTIHLVAVESTAKSTGAKLGNATSIVVTRPCNWKSGTYATDYEALENDWIQVGYDTPEVVNSIVSTVDTDAIEQQRKMNDAYKKWLQDSSKK